MKTTLAALSTLVILGFSVSANAQTSTSTDWPQILGPNRNGVIAEDKALGWSSAPKVVWEHEVGDGFAGPVIVGEELIVFHRPRGVRGPWLVVEKLNAKNGQQIWKQKIKTLYRGKMDGDTGPKATPVVQDEAIYCYGPDGKLFCLELADGAIRWEVEAREKFDAPRGYFGCGSTPLVVGEKVLVNVGGTKSAAIVAFDAKTGDVVWKAVNDSASYSSPILVKHDGKELAIFLTRTRFVGIDPETGDVLFSNKFGVRGPTAVASMPVAFDSKIFATAAYSVGATVIDLANLGDAESSIKPDWSNKNAFASHYGTPVLYKGHFYGTSGREDMRNGSFRCVEATTGTIKWNEPSFPVAHTFLIGSQLVALDFQGSLSLIEPTPEGFRRLKTARVSKVPTRAVPAYSNGNLFFRTNAKNQVGKLYAIDITP